MEKQNDFKDMDLLYEKLKSVFNNNFDIKIEKIKTVKKEAIVISVEGLVNKDLFDRDIVAPLKASEFNGDINAVVKSTVSDADNMDMLVSNVMDGNVGICYNEKAYIIDIKKFTTRSIENPESENVTRGPREGFNEDLATNTALLRRKIRNPNLVYERFRLGKQSNTIVVLAYVNGIVNREILDNVRKRLEEIKVDMVLESGKIEQYIEKNHFSAVSGIGMTQKPDIVAARILEGRVAIFCDGTPHVLTIPELFIENLHTSEDYYHRTLFANFLRLLRLVSMIISILLPGLSISIINFNPEMLPSSFLISLIAATEKTPFPEAVEVFFLMLMLELLKESGTRLPKTIGSAVSIVGALIIGEAAVNAGLISAPTVIIVALTAVSSFIVPNLNEFTTVYRIIFLFLGATFGIIGIGTGLVFMVAQLSSINSFGVPIMAFLSRQEIKDGFLRAPLTSLKFRPKSIAKDNVKRAL